jgi:hypothetical protein
VAANLVVRSVPHEDRAYPVDAHVLRTPRLANGPHLLAKCRLLPYRRALTAEFQRPGHRKQPLIAELTAEILRDREVGRIVSEGTKKGGRYVLRDEITQPLA